MEVSVFEDPGRDSLGFGRLTLGLKRAAHSNLEDPAALACSLSLVLRRGEGLEAERERRALFWSLPCLTRAPWGAALLVPAEEDDEEVEAEEEESVTVLHPALAEAADFDASLEGFAVLPSILLGRGPVVLLKPGRGSAFFRFRVGEAPAAPLFLPCPRPGGTGAGSGARALFLDFAALFFVSSVLSRRGGRDFDFLAGVGT